MGSRSYPPDGPRHLATSACLVDFRLYHVGGDQQPISEEVPHGRKGDRLNCWWWAMPVLVDRDNQAARLSSVALRRKGKTRNGAAAMHDSALPTVGFHRKQLRSGH